MAKSEGSDGTPVVSQRFSPEGIAAIQEIAREVFREEIWSLVAQAILTKDETQPTHQPATDRTIDEA